MAAWESLSAPEKELVRIIYPYSDGVNTDELLAANLTNIEDLMTLLDKSAGIGDAALQNWSNLPAYGWTISQNI